MRHLFRQISALLLCTALFFLTSCGGKEEIKGKRIGSAFLPCA